MVIKMFLKFFSGSMQISALSAKRYMVHFLLYMYQGYDFTSLGILCTDFQNSTWRSYISWPYWDSHIISRGYFKSKRKSELCRESNIVWQETFKVEYPCPEYLNLVQSLHVSYQLASVVIVLCPDPTPKQGKGSSALRVVPWSSWLKSYNVYDLH